MKGVQSQQTLAKDRLSSASLRLGGRTDGAQVLEGRDAPHATVQGALQVRSGQLAAAQQVQCLCKAVGGSQVQTKGVVGGRKG